MSACATCGWPIPADATVGQVLEHARALRHYDYVTADGGRLNIGGLLDGDGGRVEDRMRADDGA